MFENQSNNDPYKTPKGYLNSFTERMMDRIDALPKDADRTVLEEGANLSGWRKIALQIFRPISMGQITMVVVLLVMGLHLFDYVQHTTDPQGAELALRSSLMDLDDEIVESYVLGNLDMFETDELVTDDTWLAETSIFDLYPEITDSLLEEYALLHFNHENFLEVSL